MERIPSEPIQDEKNRILTSYVRKWLNVTPIASQIEDISFDSRINNNERVVRVQVKSDESLEQLLNTLEFTKLPQWVNYMTDTQTKTITFHTT